MEPLLSCGREPGWSISRDQKGNPWPRGTPFHEWRGAGPRASVKTAVQLSATQSRRKSTNAEAGPGRPKSRGRKRRFDKISSNPGPGPVFWLWTLPHPFPAVRPVGSVRKDNVHHSGASASGWEHRSMRASHRHRLPFAGDSLESPAGISAIRGGRTVRPRDSVSIQDGLRQTSEVARRAGLLCNRLASSRTAAVPGVQRSAKTPSDCHDASANDVPHSPAAGGQSRRMPPRRPSFRREKCRTRTATITDAIRKHPGSGTAATCAVSFTGPIAAP
jgi:hypothetical protein